MSRNRSTTAGFTLVEVIVTMAIVGLILSAIGAMAFSLLDRRSFVEELLRTEAIGPTLLNIVTEDLEAVFVYNLDQLDEVGLDGEEVSAGEGGIASGETDFFVGTSHGRGMSARDELHFVTSNPSKLRIGNTQSDVTEVGYFLRENPDRPGNFVLYRREDFHIDREPTRGGKAIRLYDQVIGLEFIYYARPESESEQIEPEEFDDWDHTEQERLPMAVQVTLWLDTRDGPRSSEPEPHEIRRYRTRVLLPDFPSAEELRELDPGTRSDEEDGVVEEDEADGGNED